jgi:predicted XRE-type DNA-binding protein
VTPTLSLAAPQDVDLRCPTTLQCGISQPRMNDLLRGKISKFSLDALVDVATALGCRVRMELKAA